MKYFQTFVPDTVAEGQMKFVCLDMIERRIENAEKVACRYGRVRDWLATGSIIFNLGQT